MATSRPGSSVIVCLRSERGTRSERYPAANAVGAFFSMLEPVVCVREEHVHDHDHVDERQQGGASRSGTSRSSFYAFEDEDKEPVESTSSKKKEEDMNVVRYFRITFATAAGAARVASRKDFKFPTRDAISRPDSLRVTLARSVPTPQV
ncbi:unnamed protein product [Amoebophrya sp. A25]|nr:unnamed protein product [Amoebophrya sp. A25]|eukprot:GSA25T00015735001.1